MKKWLILLLISFHCFASNFTAGKDYTILQSSTKPQATVSVVEFFNYGCPWCAYIDLHVEKWLNNKPPYVNFSRIPVSFEQGWANYSKAYFIADALGIERKITPILFAAIHGKDDKQYNDLSSEAALTAFFVQHGVKATTFKQAFNSASLDLQVKQSMAMMKVYNIYAVPAFVIGGEFTVDLKQAKSPERLMSIISYLVDKAHHV